MILNREQQAFVYIVIIKLIDTHFKSSFHQSKTIFTIFNKAFTEIRNEYIEASNIWQRQLRFTENDKQFIGEAIDIDNDGFLIVRDENNDVRRLISADIDI